MQYDKVTSLAATHPAPGVFRFQSPPSNPTETSARLRQHLLTGLTKIRIKQKGQVNTHRHSHLRRREKRHVLHGVG